MRVRAIAAAFGNADVSETLYFSGAHACWRVARAASGRLKAHPHLSYQKGATLGTVIVNAGVASFLAAAVPKNRIRRLRDYAQRVRLLSRELDDARALTWSTELSETFARSQAEIRSLIAALDAAIPSDAGVPKTKNAATAAIVAPVQGYRARATGDWPYLAH